VGALAGKGASLEDCLKTCEEVADCYATLGVALSGCHIPGQTNPLFTVQPDTFELGLGVHGEAGVETLKVQTSGQF